MLGCVCALSKSKIWRTDQNRRRSVEWDIFDIQLYKGMVGAIERRETTRVRGPQRKNRAQIKYGALIWAPSFPQKSQQLPPSQCSAPKKKSNEWEVETASNTVFLGKLGDCWIPGWWFVRKTSSPASGYSRFRNNPSATVNSVKVNFKDFWQDKERKDPFHNHWRQLLEVVASWVDGWVSCSSRGHGARH